MKLKRAEQPAGWGLQWGLGPALALATLFSGLVLLFPARQRATSFICTNTVHSIAGAPATPASEATVAAPAATGPAALHDPMQAAWEQVQADPAACDADRASKFAAAPWLLPPNCSALPYAGIHDFDELLALRGGPVSGYEKAIMLMPFDTSLDRRGDTPVRLLLNSVYSAVRMAGINNYMLWVWTNTTLADCQTFNLPCADVRPLLLEPTGPDVWRAVVVAMWSKPVLALRAARAGYVVLSIDSDVTFTTKPLLEVLTQVAVRSHADGVFQEEGITGVNSGMFLVLPHERGMQTLQAWLDRAPYALAQDRPVGEAHDQTQLNVVKEQFFRCSHMGQCLEMKELNESMPRFRLVWRWNHAYDPEDCRVAADPHSPAVDPCDATVLVVHPICANNQKIDIMKRAGHWLLDDECLIRNGSTLREQPLPEGGSAVLPLPLPACPPRQWRHPHTEARFLSCGERSLDLLLAYLRAQPLNATFPSTPAAPPR